MSPSEYIEMVKASCKKHKVRLVFKDSYSTNNCMGYFGEDTEHKTYDMELCISAKEKVAVWFPTFVHEHCHMRQWIEGSRYWLATEGRGRENSCDILWGFLDGKVKNRKINYHIGLVRDLELDCERRVLREIEKYDLPIDADVYAQQASAYVHSYNYIKEFKRWYPKGKSPYSVPEVWKELPTNLKGNYKDAPRYYINNVNRYCFGET